MVKKVIAGQTPAFNDAGTDEASTETGSIWEPAEATGEKVEARWEWMTRALSENDVPPPILLLFGDELKDKSKADAMATRWGARSRAGEWVLEWYIRNCNTR